jgi:hypothetical protein
MECKEIKDLILEYPDGDLSQSERLQVEMHLKECGECSLFLDESHQVWNLMDKWDGIEAKGDFISKFWNRVSEEGTRKRGVMDFFKNWKLGWIYVAATVVILIMSFVLVNFFQFDRTGVSLSEMDKADERLLIEFDKAISREGGQSLDVYGPWNEPIEENNKEGG